MQKNKFIPQYIYYSILLLFFIIILQTIGCANKLKQAQEEIDSLKIEISELENKIIQKESELKNYDILTNNFNKLVSTIYYGNATSLNGDKEKNFTAFGLFYNDQYYLITAGHCIEFNGKKYINFKFKSNVSMKWIEPELLYFQNDFENNNDFAIFHHEKIKRGLLYSTDDKNPKYILGNTKRKLNLFKEFSTASEGESGSPILNSGCKVIGVVIKENIDFTPIKNVIEVLEIIQKNNI